MSWRWILRSRGNVDVTMQGWPRVECQNWTATHDAYRVANQQRMAARRALEWIGTPKAWLAFRYKISRLIFQSAHRTALNTFMIVTIPTWLTGSWAMLTHSSWKIAGQTWWEDCFLGPVTLKTWATDHLAPTNSFSQPITDMSMLLSSTSGEATHLPLLHPSCSHRIYNTKSDNLKLKVLQLIHRNSLLVVKGLMARPLVDSDGRYLQTQNQYDTEYLTTRYRYRNDMMPNVGRTTI